MMDRYLEEHMPKKKSQRASRGYVQNLRAFFDDYNLSEVTPELIDKSKRLQEGVKPATLNRDLAILRNALSGAIYTSNHTQYTGRNVDEALTFSLADAGIKDFKFDDFRHRFATRLAQAGEDLYKVQKYLRHLSGETTKRYAQHSIKGLRSVSESFDHSRQKFFTMYETDRSAGPEVTEIKGEAHVAQR